MKHANGHANGVAASQQNHAERAVAGGALDASQTPRFTTDEVKRLVQELEVPFDSEVIDWRVTNTTKNGGHRGQVIPYANQRAYADRLNSLVTPAGWTRKYVIHTSANFERSKDQKTVAKVLVACELTIFGLGSHSATGEEWADDENACTSAEAQAFKRACGCFGLGRYLYDFIGVWVDLDDRKRPKKLPNLPGWATPAGWRKGARPPGNINPRSASEVRAGEDPGKADRAVEAAQSGPCLVQQIESMAELLGRPLYRGVLKSVARVWNPGLIEDLVVQQRVLEQMQAAERGLNRLHSALEGVEAETLAGILRDVKVVSLNRVDNLETLKQIVLALEALPPRS
jgi:hypothetical protein